MKIDFDNYNPDKTNCLYYEQIKVVKRYCGSYYHTPDNTFKRLSEVWKHYDIPKDYIKELFKNLDKIQLRNSEYFPALKVGVIPKYVGFNIEPKNTST